MITSKNCYDATKSRENKRIANKHCFKAIDDHTTGIGIVFPSKTAGDVRQLYEMGKIGADTRLIAFEDGTYLANAETKKPENWEATAYSDILTALNNALSNNGNTDKYDIITQDAKWARICDVYSNLDFGIYDFCCGPSCFAQWLLRYHLNAYRIGADLTFTICLGGKAALNGIGAHIQNSSDDEKNLIDLLDVENFIYTSDFTLTIVKKTLNYISRWIEVKRVSIYKDKDENGYGDAMCCFCGKLKKHFDESDEVFVQPETKLMESNTKKFVFMKKFGSSIYDSLKEFFDKNGFEKKCQKSSLVGIACKNVISSVNAFNASKAFKTKWIMQTLDMIAQESGFRVVNDTLKKYFQFEKSSIAIPQKKHTGVVKDACETPLNVIPLCDILEAQAIYMHKREFNYFNYKCENIMKFLLEVSKVAKKLDYALHIENDGTIRLVDKND